jgi:hypothetical protein
MHIEQEIILYNVCESALNLLPYCNIIENVHRSNGKPQVSNLQAVYVNIRRRYACA